MPDSKSGDPKGREGSSPSRGTKRIREVRWYPAAEAKVLAVNMYDPENGVHALQIANFLKRHPTLIRRWLRDAGVINRYRNPEPPTPETRLLYRTWCAARTAQLEYERTYKAFGMDRQEARNAVRRVREHESRRSS